MKADMQSMQAEQSTGSNPVVTILVIAATTVVGAAATLFGLHAIGANENKHKNRASGAFAWFQRKTGDDEAAKRIETNTTLSNIATGAKIVSNKISACATTTTTVVSACVEHVVPK